jgi:hypothetical protein
MKVLVPNRSFIANTLGAMLFALTLSFGANAYQQDYSQQTQQFAADEKEIKDYHEGEQFAEKTNDCHEDEQFGQETKDCHDSEQFFQENKGCHKGEQFISDQFQPDSKKNFHSQISMDQTQTLQTSCNNSFGGGYYNNDSLDEYYDHSSSSDSSSDEDGFRTSCGAYFGLEKWETDCTDKHYLRNQIKSNQRRLTSFHANKQYAHGRHMHRKDWDNLQWSNVKIDEADFSRISAHKAKWFNVKVSGNFNLVHFDNADIKNTTFSGRFHDTDFKEAQLKNVKFEWADFRLASHSSNFDGATLENVQFAHCDLNSMTFKGAKLHNVVLDQSRINNYSFLRGAKIKNRKGHWKEIKSKHLQKLAYYNRNNKSKNINLNDWFCENF